MYSAVCWSVSVFYQPLGFCFLLYSGTSLHGISQDWPNFSHRLMKFCYSQYRNKYRSNLQDFKSSLIGGFPFLPGPLERSFTVHRFWQIFWLQQNYNRLPSSIFLYYSTPLAGNFLYGGFPLRPPLLSHTARASLTDFTLITTTISYSFSSSSSLLLLLLHHLPVL